MNKEAKLVLVLVVILAIVAIIMFAQKNYQKKDLSDQPVVSDAKTTQIQQPAPVVDNSVNIKMTIIKEGKGAVTKGGDVVSVHYVGKFSDGKVFDSNQSPAQPFQFTLGQNRVIQGWEQGVLGMKAGEIRHLSIPPLLAYGPSGMPPVIPPSATLEFDVELVAINSK